jgi:mono/diheme cytochrome c family protein
LSDYLLHCGGCHLENGSGNPPEVPDLRRDIDWLAGTAEGRSYLTRVPGASQVPISDARLAAVFNWIFETYYPAVGVEPFTAAEVAQTRALPLYDPLKARRELTRERLAANP